MSDSALIDDLERQFAENPRRVFARLANEYRKAGDAERAIDLCLSHVPQQPGYISGHIVLGQALFDTGRYDEAKSAFETALGLDPENLIALRQLGDIARETGSSDDARSWYRRLLEVDPQNEEITAQLEELDASASPTPDVPMVDTGAAPEPEPVSWGDIHPEGPSTEPAPPVSDVVALDDGSADGAARGDASHGVIANDVGLEVEQAFPAMFATDPSAVTLQSDGHDDAGDLEPIRLDGDASNAGDGAIVWNTDDSAVPPIGFEPTSIELPDPIEPQEAPAVDPAMDAPGVAASTPPWLASTGDQAPAELGAEAMTAGAADDTGAAPADVAPLEVMPTEVVMGMPDDAGPQDVASADVVMSMPDAESGAPPDAFVTETMADLYLQQGFTARALDVYRQLAAQYPDNPRFQEQIALLREAVDSAPNERGASLSEAGGDDWSARPARTGPTIRAFLSAIAGRGAVAAGSEWTPGSEPAAMDASAAMEASTAMDASTTADASVATETATDVDAELAAAPYEEPSEQTPVPDATPANVGALDASDTSDTDGMFPGWTVSAEDDAVGQALDEAYADGNVGNDGRDGMPSHRAVDELSLDAIFRDAAGRDGHRQNGQGVSFEEFFADDDNQGAERSPGTANGDARDDDGASADLELFHAWLEGLKK
jgi:tetratricopeptide (TPR) repeat protein